MGSAFLVSHLDFARSFEGDPFSATPESIAKWLERNWLPKRGGGTWNYSPAMEVLVLGFAGEITLSQALEHCGKYWHPHGREENILVVRAFWRYVTENKSRVYKRNFLAAPVGRWRERNIFIGIKAPLIRVTDEDVLAIMPVFRKNFVPDDAETNLSLTAVREFCFREGYRDIDTELMTARGVGGARERQLLVDRGSKRSLYTTDQFDGFAAKYAGAVSILADAGKGLQTPNFRGYRVWNPDEPPLPGI